jgi:hypothetical protein
MRPKAITLFFALVTTPFVNAESLPTFHPATSSYRATHIVLVETESGNEGKFRVVESWKGDLKKDATLTIPGLAKDAKGQMVLFLRQNPKKPGADQWQPTGIGKDWKVSVVWIDGDTVSAVDQPENPGPAFIQPIPYIKSRGALKEIVDYYTKTERALADAKATKDLDKRVAALAAIINGQFDRKEEAFALLGECGPKAVPALRKLLEGKPTHDHKYAVAAMATAGGKEVVPELAKMIELEIAYWAETGPKLEKGWWFNTDSEAWKRHGKLCAFVESYRTHPTSALRKQVVAVRDLMRNLPVVDADRGIASISAQCDRVLKDDGD